VRPHQHSQPLEILSLQRGAAEVVPFAGRDALAPPPARLVGAGDPGPHRHLACDSTWRGGAAPTAIQHEDEAKETGLVIHARGRFRKSLEPRATRARPERHSTGSMLQARGRSQREAKFWLGASWVAPLGRPGSCRRRTIPDEPGWNLGWSL